MGRRDVNFTVVETATGALAIAWNERGIVGSWMHAGTVERAREQVRRSYPTAAETGPPDSIATALTGARRLLSGELRDLQTAPLDLSDIPDFDRRVYDIVRVANQRGAEGVRAGMSGRDADALARDYIERAGFGPLFGHSLGHGIGLEVHEAPRLARTAEGVLAEGAVVTIEPGVYRPGWGGVRIEDDVVLGADGPRLLTNFPRELIELG